MNNRPAKVHFTSSFQSGLNKLAPIREEEEPPMTKEVEASVEVVVKRDDSLRGILRRRTQEQSVEPQVPTTEVRRRKVSFHAEEPQSLLPDIKRLFEVDAENPFALRCAVPFIRGKVFSSQAVFAKGELTELGAYLIKRVEGCMPAERCEKLFEECRAQADTVRTEIKEMIDILSASIKRCIIDAEEVVERHLSAQWFIHLFERLKQCKEKNRVRVQDESFCQLKEAAEKVIQMLDEVEGKVPLEGEIKESLMELKENFSVLAEHYYDESKQVSWAPGLERSRFDLMCCTLGIVAAKDELSSDFVDQAIEALLGIIMGEYLSEHKWAALKGLMFLSHRKGLSGNQARAIAEAFFSVGHYGGIVMPSNEQKCVPGEKYSKEGYIMATFGENFFKHVIFKDVLYCQKLFQEALEVQGPGFLYAALMILIRIMPLHKSMDLSVLFDKDRKPAYIDYLLNHYLAYDESDPKATYKCEKKEDCWPFATKGLLWAVSPFMVGILQQQSVEAHRLGNVVVILLSVLDEVHNIDLKHILRDNLLAILEMEDMRGPFIETCMRYLNSKDSSITLRTEGFSDAELVYLYRNIKRWIELSSEPDAQSELSERSSIRTDIIETFNGLSFELPSVPLHDPFEDF